MKGTTAARERASYWGTPFSGVPACVCL